ncbi:MAG: peptide/nickel transport system substrate-binding protein, partial [Subtercola sp.]|nr:peptide/nickel transport system substrate-binding protein [Subtercola sp.]
MIRRIIPAASALIVGLLLTSCASNGASTDTSGAAVPTAITVGLPAQPPSTDPILTRSISAWNIYYAIYDGLTRIDAAGALQPGLATTWEHSDDLTQWTFHIRDGVTFSDGTELKASDIVYTYRTILASDKSTNRSAISMVTNVEVNPAGDVVFTLKNPYSAFEKVAAT